MGTKTLAGFWEGDDRPKWAGLCLNFCRSLEEHEPPELMAAAKSVDTILGKKPKTPEKGTRRSGGHRAAAELGKMAVMGGTRSSASHGGLNYGTLDDIRRLVIEMKKHAVRKPEVLQMVLDVLDGKKSVEQGQAFTDRPPNVIKGRISCNHILGMITSEEMLIVVWMILERSL
jgi:hypothetical protein